MTMICKHGQEFWCRICGTIDHIVAEEKPEQAKQTQPRDHNNERASIWYYYNRIKDSKDDSNP